MAERLLEVKGLKVEFTTEDGTVHAVDGVDFELDRGKVLGIVGESGSGKSVTAMTILGLTRDRNTHFEGEVEYKGQNLLEMSESRLRDVRGNEIAMIFQDPMTSLNPVYTSATRSSRRSSPTKGRRRRMPGGAPSSCCGRSGSRTPSSARATIRTSSRAACASER